MDTKRTDASLARELGRRIAVLRTSQEISQESLARRIGVTRTMVAKWEGGQNTPTLSQIVRLSRILRVTLDQLLLGRDFELPGQGLPRRERVRLHRCIRTIQLVLSTTRGIGDEESISGEEMKKA